MTTRASARVLAPSLRRMASTWCFHGPHGHHQSFGNLAVLQTSWTSINPRITALTILGLVRARREDHGHRPPLDEAWDLAEPTGELYRLGPVAAARAEAAWLGCVPDGVAPATELALVLALRCGWALADELSALVGQVALVRTSLQHVGALTERQLGPEPEDAHELGGGLTVGAHRAGSLRGGEGEADDSVGVPGRFGVMGQVGKVHSVACPTGDGSKSMTVQTSFTPWAKPSSLG